jgi:hypothetical protein
LRFRFLDDVVYESASSREHRALGFCSFWWGFWFLRFVLLSHTHFTQNSKHLSELYTSAGGRRWHKSFTCFLCRFLPSVFNTSSSRDTNYAIFDILPDNGAKMLVSKYVLKTILVNINLSTRGFVVYFKNIDKVYEDRCRGKNRVVKSNLNLPTIHFLTHSLKF